MAYKLRFIEIPLQKEYENFPMPFFYTEKTASFRFQTQYYRIQEYHAREQDALEILSGARILKGKHVLPGALFTHLCTWRTSDSENKDKLALNGKTNKDEAPVSSEVSWKHAEKWIKTVEKLGDNFSEVDPDQLVTQFLGYFRRYGLFDCRSLSFSSLTTLHLFYVLLDLIPQVAAHCVELISNNLHAMPGFGFLGYEEISRTKDTVWKSALLAVLLEEDQSTSIFLGGLAYLENKILHSLCPDICLLVGDINDPDLFGFKHTEYVEKRLQLYKQASKATECHDQALFRCLGIVTLLPEEFMSKITQQMVKSQSLDLSMLEEWPKEFASMVAYIDFHICKPLDQFATVKERLISEIQSQEDGESISNLEKLYNTVSSHLQPGLCRLFIKDNLAQVRVGLEMKEYPNALTSVVGLLKSKMALDKMSELLYLTLELLRGLKDTSAVGAAEIQARRSIECFEVIQHRFLDYAIEKGHLQSSLYFLGKLYMDTVDQRTGIEILMSGFLLVPESVTDLSFRRRTFKYLMLKSDNTSPKQILSQLAIHVEERLSEEDGPDEIREKVAKMVIDLIEDRIMKEKYQNSKKEAFTESIQGETIRPSISYTLSTLLKVVNGQQPPTKEQFLDLDLALQDVFKPKSFFSKLSPLGLAGLTKTEDPSAKAGPQEDTSLTVDQVMKQIASDPKLRLFSKECFDISGTVSGMETFDYNGCNVYKGSFHTNQQKVIIFEVDYGDLFTPSIFKSVLCYLKIFHQQALCFYGVIVESGQTPNSIKIYYVAEHVDWFLSRASATHIESLSDKYRAGVCADILSCLGSFHAVGIPFCQLNPDLVAFTSGKAKLIFPFFLNSRLFFTNHYLVTRVTDDQMFPSLLFIKPEILRKPELLSSGVSPFRKDFVEKFGPSMNGDLYSFTLIVAYLHLPRFFTRAEFSPACSVQNYFTRIFTNSMRGAWAEELFEAPNLVKLRPILTTLFKETTLPVNTFKLLATVQSAWEDSVSPVTPISTRRSFVESLAFTTSQPQTSYAYFPGGIVADWPDEDPAMSRVYLQNNLLMLGPFWSAQDNDSYQLELFADDYESIKFEITKGSVSRAKIISKERKAEEIVQRTKLQIDHFCTSTFLPKRSVLEALMAQIKNAGSPRSRDPIQAATVSFRNFLAAGEKLCSENSQTQQWVLDPFGNQIWTTFSEAGFPELSGAVFIESYTAHNLGKSIILIQDKHPGRWMSTRIGTFGLGEASETWGKYVDLIRDFDTMNWGASMILSPLGFIYNGSLQHGCPKRGLVMDANMEGTIAVETGEFSEQEVFLGSNTVYRGEVANSTLNGQGLLLKNSKQSYQGYFKDGLPHGKGKIYSTLDEQTVFTGYFKWGKPVFGTIIGKKRSCSGWIMSPPEGMDGGLAFSSHALGLNSWVNGFPDDSELLSLFAVETPAFSFEEMAIGDKLSIAPNATYQGAVDNKVPHGRGVLELQGLGILNGIFKSKKKDHNGPLQLEVVGHFNPKNKNLPTSLLEGVFDVHTVADNGSLGLAGFCQSQDKLLEGWLKTKLDQTGSSVVYWEHLSSPEGSGRKTETNTAWSGVVKVLDQLNSTGAIWEYWDTNAQEITVVADNVVFQIQELPNLKTKDFKIKGKFRKVSHNCYQLAGAVEFAKSGLHVELSSATGKLLGVLKSNDGEVKFSGLFGNALEPSMGQLETTSPSRISRGSFNNLELEEEGTLEHPTDSVLVEGKFASGKKTGIAIAYVQGQKTMLCQYHEDLRHGHALRLWPQGRQLMEFNFGDLTVVYEVEEFK